MMGISMNFRIGWVGAILMLVGVGWNPAAVAADWAMVHATALPGRGQTIEDATILVKNGRIEAIGSGLPVPGGTSLVVDATGKYVTPGLVDLHSHMGVYAWPHGSAHNDGNESIHPVTPAVWAGDGVRVDDIAFARARAGGVTTVLVIPGSANLIGGQGVVLKLRPSRTLAGMQVVGAPRHIKMACGENPKRVYQSDTNGPTTRMGNVAWMRETFIAAQDYKRDSRRAENPIPRDPDMETVLDVLEGRIRVNVHCYRADDIEAVIRTMDAFGVKVSAFHHGTDAYKVRDLIAAHGAGVATWPDWWGFKFEAMDAIPEGVLFLKDAGIRVATHSDSPETVQRLFIEAAKHVGVGLDETRALETITIDPAMLLGLGDRIGSLEVGKDADLALFSSHPFDVRTLVERTWIEGELVYDRALEGVPHADQ